MQQLGKHGEGYYVAANVRNVYNGTLYRIYDCRLNRYGLGRRRGVERYVFGFRAQENADQKRRRRLNKKNQNADFYVFEHGAAQNAEDERNAAVGAERKQIFGFGFCYFGVLVQAVTADGADGKTGGQAENYRCGATFAYSEQLFEQTAERLAQHGGATARDNYRRYDEKRKYRRYNGMKTQEDRVFGAALNGGVIQYQDRHKRECD